LRIITTFTNRHVSIVHDTGADGAVVPEGIGQFRRVVDLAEFWRCLHLQRRVHQATGEPFTITQEIRDVSFDRAPAIAQDAGTGAA